MKKRIKVKKGQVWVETVMYLLIAFSIIGLILAYAKPKIEEMQDELIIEQTIEVMQELNSIILDIRNVAGNQRKIELGIKKGELKIDSQNDLIFFEIESGKEYSQSGEEIYIGDILVKTENKGGYNVITLKNDYSGKYNITYQGEDQLKTLSESSTPYTFLISNKGGNPINIDIK